MMGYYGYGWNMMRPGYGFGGLLSVIFWILVGFLFILLILKLLSHGSSDKYEDSDEKEDTPLNILKKRYAKGEITLREFEKMKRDIS